MVAQWLDFRGRTRLNVCQVLEHSTVQNQCVCADSVLLSILVLLDLSAALTPLTPLLQRLAHVIEIKGTRLGWFRSYLSGFMIFPLVVVFHKVLYFWTNLFTLCMLLWHWTHFHFFAAKPQLYLFIKTQRKQLVNSRVVFKLTSNPLLLNPDKTVLS